MERGRSESRLFVKRFLDLKKTHLDFSRLEGELNEPRLQLTMEQRGRLSDRTRP